MFSVVCSPGSCSADDAFDFDAGMMAEIDEQADAMAGGLEIIVNLRAMLIGEFAQRLQLHDHLVEADEVGLELAAELAALVFEFEPWLLDKQNALQCELQLQALLIHRLDKAAALLLVNLEARTTNGKRLLLQNQF